MSQNDRTVKAKPNKNVVAIRRNPELLTVKPLTYKEMVESAPEPIKYICSPWLPEQGIAVIYAASGVGKTLFALNIAYAIATGGNFLTYKCPSRKRVLYVDGEMSYKEVHERFTDIRRQQGDMKHGDYWNLLTPDKVHPQKLPKIGSAEGQDFYNRIIEEGKIEVLFLDNLAVLSEFEDSNQETWLPIQNWLLELRASGITVVLVHHAGKDKEGYRGTSRIIDCMNTAISLQCPEVDRMESDVINSKKFKIVYHKARGFGGKDAMPFEVVFSANGWNFQSVERSFIHDLVEMINIGMTHQQIANEVKKSRSYISKIYRKAVSEGLLISREK